MKEAGWKGPLASEDARLGPAGHAGGGLERYFAREGVDPLPYAFEGKIAVHPGLGGAGVDKKDFEATLEPLLARPRMGKTVAYIHVPFCETHCLYCGFYNKAYRPGESAAYADTLDRELTLWADRPAQAQGPVHAVYLGGGTPTALEADDLYLQDCFYHEPLHIHFLFLFFLIHSHECSKKFSYCYVIGNYTFRITE